ncbi:MAG: DUF1292 domain-containing protein [Clostridiales bacterium]|mgnify:FL=1|nr:DUF1292 domain-containing protein [Clostridiales bacterium]
MEENKDILIFINEDDEEIKMEILDYFHFQDQEYVLLAPVDGECTCQHCDCSEQELYIMKVVINGEMEEFHPVEEEKLETLIQAIELLYDEQAEEDEDGLELED